MQKVNILWSSSFSGTLPIIQSLPNLLFNFLALSGVLAIKMLHCSGLRLHLLIIPKIFETELTKNTASFDSISSIFPSPFLKLNFSKFPLKYD